MRDRIRYYLYTLGKFSLFKNLYLLYYRLAIKTVKRSLVKEDFIDNLYLKGSYLGNYFEPVLSDLDFVLIGDNKKENYQKVQKTIKQINLFFPMVSDFDFYDEKTFEVIKTYGGLKYAHLESWVCLKGETTKTSYIYHPMKYELDVLHEIFFQLEWLFKNLNRRKSFKLYQSLVIQRQYYKVKDLLYKLLEYKESIELFEISKIWEDLSDEEIINRFNVIISSNPRAQRIIDFYLKKAEYFVVEDILNQEYYKDQLKVVNKNYKYDGKLHYFTMPTFKLFFYTGCIDLDVLYEHAKNEKDLYLSKLYKNFYMARILNLKDKSEKQENFIQDELENIYKETQKALIHFPHSTNFIRSYFGKDLNIMVRWNPDCELPERLKLDDLVIVEFVNSYDQVRHESLNAHCEYIQIVIPSIYYAIPAQERRVLSIVINWFHQANSLRLILDKPGSREIELEDFFQEPDDDLSDTRIISSSWLSWCQYINKVTLKEDLFYSLWWNIYNVKKRKEVFHYNCDSYLNENHYKDIMDIKYLSENAPNVHECLYTINNFDKLSDDEFKSKVKLISRNNLKVFAETTTKSCEFSISYEESKDPVELTLRFHLVDFYKDMGEYTANFFFDFDFNMIQNFDKSFIVSNQLEQKQFFTYEHLRKYQALSFFLDENNQYVDISFNIQLNTGDYNVSIESIGKSEDYYFPVRRVGSDSIKNLTIGTYKLVSFINNSSGNMEVKYLNKSYGKYHVRPDQKTINSFLNIVTDGAEVVFDKESFLKVLNVDILRYVHPSKMVVDLNKVYHMESFLDKYLLECEHFEETQFLLLRTFDKKIQGREFVIDDLRPGFYKLVFYLNGEISGGIEFFSDNSFVKGFHFLNSRVAVAMIYAPIWNAQNMFKLDNFDGAQVEKVDIMEYKKEFVPVRLNENYCVDYNELIGRSDDEYYNYYGKIENLDLKIIDKKIHLPFHNEGCFKIIVFFDNEQRPEMRISCNGKEFNLPGVNTGMLWIGFVIVSSDNLNKTYLEIHSDDVVNIDHIDIRKMDYSKAFSVN